MRKRKSIRLRNWNYSQAAYYYLTICSYKRELIFGDIENGKMVLNQYGKIVKNHWLNLTSKYIVKLNDFIVMPNHMHCILIINNDNQNGQEDPAPTIGNIIGFFKYKTTVIINEEKRRGGVIPPEVVTKIWQRNYYEHIIRNEKELRIIKKYIEDNPLKWHTDKDNPQNMINN